MPLAAARQHLGVGELADPLTLELIHETAPLLVQPAVGCSPKSGGRKLCRVPANMLSHSNVMWIGALREHDRVEALELELLPEDAVVGASQAEWGRSGEPIPSK
mgnify:CR=1 FL=1|jgi:hypothetical protein